MKKNKKGIALIAVIMLIAVVTVTVGGIASFVANNLVLSATRAARTKALYAAQAGVYNAIYASRYSNADWKKNRDIQLCQGVSYSYGQEANFIRVDATAPRLGNWFTSGPPGPGSFGVVERLSFRNTSSETITMNRIKFEWYNVNDPSFVFRGIRMGASRYIGHVPSGQIIDLSPFYVMQPNSGIGDVWLFFSKSVPTDIVLIVTFYFTDASARKAVLLNNSRSGNNEISVTSTGKVSGNPVFKRTIEATYDFSMGTITSWQEVETHI